MLKSSASPKLLFILTGSIALYKVMHVLSHFKKLNYNLKIIATESALKFVGLSTLEGLTSEKVHVDLYANGSNMDHIHLIRWADAVIVAPATANYINKIANGIADDLASTAFLAHDFQKPFIVMPAMNTKMYEHPSTQKSVAQLKAWGVQVLDSTSGSLACGETGAGRLLEPEQMISAIENLELQQEADVIIRKASMAPVKKILISSGGTQEPIDDVRVISNKSTGRTAAFIADQLTENGFHVTYLAAENAKLPLLECEVVKFTTFADLELQMRKLVPEHSAFIHTAAVSDYSVIPSEGKINSNQEEVTLKLKRNPKLIELVKRLNPNIKLIGFKLTSTNDPQTIQEKVTGLFERAQCDVVIHNDWSSMKSGNHLFNIYSENNITKNNLTLEDLSHDLIFRCW